MSTHRFSPEFKEEAVRQVVERGYGVPDVAARLGVSAHSLYKWVKAASPDRSEQQSKELLEAKSEVLRLRSQLRRVEEERDILKNRRRVVALLCAVETPATLARGGELPMAYWRRLTPLKNVAHGPMRT
jgi:transposase